MKELRSPVCIVGVDESDEIGTVPNKSQLTLHLEAIHNAVRDAGLKVSDVDGIFTAGSAFPGPPGRSLGYFAAVHRRDLSGWLFLYHYGWPCPGGIAPWLV